MVVKLLIAITDREIDVHVATPARRPPRQFLRTSTSTACTGWPPRRKSAALLARIVDDFRALLIGLDVEERPGEDRHAAAADLIDVRLPCDSR